MLPKGTRLSQCKGLRVAYLSLRGCSSLLWPAGKRYLLYLWIRPFPSLWAGCKHQLLGCFPYKSCADFASWSQSDPGETRVVAPGSFTMAAITELTVPGFRGKGFPNFFSEFHSRSGNARTQEAEAAPQPREARRPCAARRVRGRRALPAPQSCRCLPGSGGCPRGSLCHPRRSLPAAATGRRPLRRPPRQTPLAPGPRRPPPVPPWPPALGAAQPRPPTWPAASPAALPREQPRPRPPRGPAQRPRPSARAPGAPPGRAGQWGPRCGAVRPRCFIGGQGGKPNTGGRGHSGGPRTTREGVWTGPGVRYCAWCG